MCRLAMAVRAVFRPKVEYCQVVVATKFLADIEDPETLTAGAPKQFVVAKWEYYPGARAAFAASQPVTQTSSCVLGLPGLGFSVTAAEGR